MKQDPDNYKSSRELEGEAKKKVLSINEMEDLEVGLALADEEEGPSVSLSWTKLRAVNRVLSLHHEVVQK